MDRLLIGFFIGIIFESFNWWTCEPIRKRWRRKCNYNCETCRVWDCDKHLCDEQKRKDQKRKNKKPKRYKVCKLREKNGEELIMYETYSFFKAFKEYNRLKFKYPSLHFKLYFKI